MLSFSRETNCPWQEKSPRSRPCPTGRRCGKWCSPSRPRVQADASLVQALVAIIKENTGTMPSLEDDKVVGMVRLTELFLEISQEILKRIDSEQP
jgi:hypothetical protein